MKKKWLAAMLGAAAMTLSAGALAQQTAPGWYVGGDIGNADFGDEDDTAFRILGGYQINRNFAAEIGYSRLLDKGGVEASAWELVGVGSFPIANRLSVFGKLGFAMTTVEAAGVDDDDTDLTFGVGLQYDLTPKFGIRGQWQRYQGEDDDADVLSVGIIYRF